MPDPRTINGLIEATIRRYPQRPALGMAFAPPLTYARLGDSVRSLTAALSARGLSPGQAAAILAENSPQWGIAYLAITGCGAVAVPILPDFPVADIHHILREAGVRMVFTSGNLLDKVLEFNGPQLNGLFTLDDSDPEHLQSTATVSALIDQGAALLADPETAISPLPAGPDDTAAIIYTSGTSGHAKAVMLSHANITANVRSAQAIIDLGGGSVQHPSRGYWTESSLPSDSVQPPLMSDGDGGEDRGPTFLSILPLAHTYEFTVGFVLPLAQGGRVVYCDKAPTPTVLEKICRQERPDAICAVPMVMDKIYKKKVLPAINASFWLRSLAKCPWGRRLVMKRIGARLLDFFGGNLKDMAIGGAALNLQTETFLREAGFPYIAGYGLTETAPLLAAGRIGDPSVALGSVGPPVPGVEIRIDQPDPESGVGQIMARGANIMQGYYQNPALTAETIDQEGWLATGDLGFVDEVGNLHIKGRSKSVIVLSHGENIYPEVIEERINALAEVVDSLVLERDGRLEALVYLDYEVLEREATGQEDSVQPSLVSDEGQRRRIGQRLEAITTTVNQGLPVYSRLHQVREQTEPFIKTATHKIKRYLYQ